METNPKIIVANYLLWEYNEMIRIAPFFPLVLDENGSYRMHGSSEEDIKAVINQNIKNVLLTNPGERLFDVNFGAGLRRYLFEFPDTIETGENLPPLTSNIISQLSSYIPYVKVNDINVSTVDNALSVRIEYSILQNLEDPVTSFSMVLPFNI
jgi:phage baseplate assembly protein W